MFKKSLLIIGFIFTCSTGFSETNLFNIFLKTLGKVESSENSGAFNKKENAIGIYQIRPAYFKDAQKQDKTLNKYKHSDCYNIEVSKKVVRAYMNRYCKNGSIEELARCHNSGWNWKNKTNLTDGYWKKFLAKM